MVGHTGLDWFLIEHFGMTHPDIWLMWAVILLTPFQLAGIVASWRQGTAAKRAALEAKKLYEAKETLWLKSSQQ